MLNFNFIITFNYNISLTTSTNELKYVKPLHRLVTLCHCTISRNCTPKKRTEYKKQILTQTHNHHIYTTQHTHSTAVVSQHYWQLQLSTRGASTHASSIVSFNTDMTWTTWWLYMWIAKLSGLERIYERL